MKTFFVSLMLVVSANASGQERRVECNRKNFEFLTLAVNQGHVMNNSHLAGIVSAIVLEDRFAKCTVLQPKGSTVGLRKEAGVRFELESEGELFEIYVAFTNGDGLEIWIDQAY